MLEKNLESADEKLRQAISSGDVRAVDDAVANIISLGNVGALGILLSALDDNAEYDEGMFSIIHASESFPDPYYIKGFLDYLPTLVNTSPKWASILLMRILNDEKSRRNLVREMASCQIEEKAAVEWLCNQINKRDVRFLSKTTPVLVSARL